MSINNKFIESGNASIINEKCYPYYIPMFEYEAIVDFCREQIAHIHVTKTSGEKKIYCEPILRFMIDISNGDLLTYIIFSNQREQFDKKSCFIIRKILWERKKDIEWLKQYPEKRKESLLSWPAMQVKNAVMGYRDAQNIISLLHQTDELVKNGIVLNKRNKHDAIYWEDIINIELMRRYDWGEIRSCWGTSMQNINIEHHIYSSIEVLEKELLKKHKDVFKIELDYIFPINEFKKCVSKADVL